MYGVLTLTDVVNSAAFTTSVVNITDEGVGCGYTLSTFTDIV